MNHVGNYNREETDAYINKDLNSESVVNRIWFQESVGSFDSDTQVGLLQLMQQTIEHRINSMNNLRTDRELEFSLGKMQFFALEAFKLRSGICQLGCDRLSLLCRKLEICGSNPLYQRYLCPTYDTNMQKVLNETMAQICTLIEAPIQSVPTSQAQENGHPHHQQPQVQQHEHPQPGRHLHQYPTSNRDFKHGMTSSQSYISTSDHGIINADPSRITKQNDPVLPPSESDLSNCPSSALDDLKDPFLGLDLLDLTDTNNLGSDRARNPSSQSTHSIPQFSGEESGHLLTHRLLTIRRALASCKSIEKKNRLVQLYNEIEHKLNNHQPSKFC